MFEVLSASRPQARVGAHRYLLSLSFHSVLVVGAVALTRHPVAATHTRPPEPGILFVAPQPSHGPSPAATPELPPSLTRPAPPSWPPDIEAPDLRAPELPAGVPTVADLLNGAGPQAGPATGTSALSMTGAAPTAAEPLTAAAVDDPVEVIEQPVPRYPSALAQGGISGRVELEYVVDTAGRAEAGSLRTLRSTHPAFEAAARASVLATRYRPARVRGRPVRQLVRQSLSFRLDS
jgi:periplasmic protein TonB